MKKYRVHFDTPFRLKDYSPGDSGDFRDNEKDHEEVEEKTLKLLGKLDDLQQMLYADGRKSLLIVLQAMDTGGKDGTIKHVMRGVNPQGCKVASFKAPTPFEAAHDFLWRVHQQVPPKGNIGIFNRSHYEDVLVTRVHGMIDRKTAEYRYKEINNWEKMLHRNGTTIVKFFLHISKDEQRRRLQDRAKDPKKHWKFSINDLGERKFWSSYQKVFQDTLRATSTDYAPWYVIPANHKWYRNLVVAKIIVDALEDMKLSYPPPPKGVNFKTLRID